MIESTSVSGPPPRGRGPALLIGIVTTATLALVAGAVWPVVGMYQAMRSIDTATSAPGGWGNAEPASGPDRKHHQQQRSRHQQPRHHLA